MWVLLCFPGHACDPSSGSALQFTGGASDAENGNGGDLK